MSINLVVDILLLPSNPLVQALHGVVLRWQSEQFCLRLMDNNALLCPLLILHRETN